jgi:hypothetical protein
MEVSVRNAAECIGLAGEFSVFRDFFGFLAGRPTGLGTISLREQIDALRSKHVHLDVILVAPEDISAAGRRDLSFGIHTARDVLGQVGIGIGRVSYFIIPKAEADGFDVITKKREAKKLTRKYRGPNDDAMDLFVVPEYNVISGGENKAGICAIPGCNKNLYAFNGCVIGMRNLTSPGGVGGVRFTRLIAHELTHGLGRIHRNISSNLMEKGGVGTNLTIGQGRRMRRDCFVQDGCNI